LNANLRRKITGLIHRLLTEGDSPFGSAFSVGAGIFIGCLPLYGLHLVLCIVTARLFDLNRVKMYLASNLSVPLIAPFLLLLEIQTGSLLRRGTIYTLSRQSLETTSLWHYPQDLLLGSVVVGAVLGALGFLVTVALRPPRGLDTPIRQLTELAARRYLRLGLATWWRVRRELRGDLAAVLMVTSGVLPRQGTLVDVGFGRGTLMALVLAYREFAAQSTLPSGWAPPTEELRLYGLESCPDTVQIAREALGHEVRLTLGPLEGAMIPPCEAVALPRSLHRLPAGTQTHLIRSAATALSGGGVLLIRDADAAAEPWKPMLETAGFSLIHHPSIAKGGEHGLEVWAASA
jgi:uncharacterized protein (DUF2062 family)